MRSPFLKNVASKGKPDWRSWRESCSPRKKQRYPMRKEAEAHAHLSEASTAQEHTHARCRQRIETWANWQRWCRATPHSATRKRAGNWLRASLQVDQRATALPKQRLPQTRPWAAIPATRLDIGDAASRPSQLAATREACPKAPHKDGLLVQVMAQRNARNAPRRQKHAAKRRAVNMHSVVLGNRQAGTQKQ